MTGPPADVCSKTLARPAGLARPRSPDPAGWASGSPEVDLRGASSVTADILSRALAAPGAESLVSLDLSGLPLKDAGKALGAAFLPSLRRLWAEDTSLGEVGLRGLFSAEGLPALEVLDVSGAGLEVDGLGVLVRAPLMGTVRSLDLRQSEVPGAMILDALVDAPRPALVCLAVSGPVPEATQAAWASQGVRLLVSP